MKARPGRIEIYKKICRMVGIAKPSSKIGYFSRKELSELLFYLDMKKLESKVPTIYKNVQE